MAVVVGQSLDRRDLAAHGAGRRRGAGSHGLTVEVNRARAALRNAAGELGARQADVVTQYPQQRRLGLGIDLVGVAVDIQCKSHQQLPSVGDD